MQIDKYQTQKKCGTGMLIKDTQVQNETTLEQTEEAKFLPLTEVNANVKIHDSISTIRLVQDYSNLGDSPIEATFQFPNEKNSIISNMSITLGEKTIKTKIMEKKKAQQKYDDAMAAGNQATMIKETKMEMYQIDVGNILPGQKAIVQITIIRPLNGEDGIYHFNLPISYFPQSLSEKDKVSFNFSAEILSPEKQITEISHPENFQILSQDLYKIIVQKIDSDFNEIKHDVKISFRTQGMDEPKLVFQRSSNHPGKVAVMAQFLPCFTQPEKKELMAVTSDLEEEDLKQELDYKYQYIFLVDRSGSMGLNNRMSITLDAMKLFMQSLPTGSQFGIISFGSNCQYMRFKNGSEIVDYNDNTKQIALDNFNQFDSDMGGTDILFPLTLAFSSEKAANVKRRIFLLTDGSVGNTSEITEYIRKSCSGSDDTKVFTFGIGSGCSEQLVIDAAKAGKGDYSIVADNNPKELKKKVVASLKNASEPCLQDCQFYFQQSKIRNLRNLWRNEIVREYDILTESMFDTLDAQFIVDYDPVSKSKTTSSFKFDDFKQLYNDNETDALDHNDELFKLAARQQIDELDDLQSKVAFSTQYQVLCQETALIGVIKQDNKNDEECEQIQIKNAYVKIPAKEQPQQNFLSNPHMLFGSSMPQAQSAALMRRGSYDEEEEDVDMGGLFGDDSDYGYECQKPMAAQIQVSKAIEEEEDVDMGGLFGDGDDYGEEEYKEPAIVESKQISQMESSSKITAPSMPSAPSMPIGMAQSPLSGPPSVMASSQDSLQKKKMAQKSKIDGVSFECLISQQSSDGFWSLQSEPDLSKYLNFESLLKKYSDLTNVIYTLVALQILELKFEEEKEEWGMISKKAKKWLRKQNVQNHTLDFIKQSIKAIEFN